MAVGGKLPRSDAGDNVEASRALLDALQLRCWMPCSCAVPDVLQLRLLGALQLRLAIPRREERVDGGSRLL